MILSLSRRAQLCLAMFMLGCLQLQGLLCPRMVGLAQNRRVMRVVQPPSNFIQENSIETCSLFSNKARQYTTFLRSSPQRVEKTVIKRGTVTTADTSEEELEETDVDAETKTAVRDEIEQNWRLIMHDDEIHELDEVPEMIAEACPLCTLDRAWAVTMEVHTTGLATVATACKKLIEEYSYKMQHIGLSVSIAPDDDYVGAEGDNMDMFD